MLKMSRSLAAETDAQYDLNTCEMSGPHVICPHCKLSRVSMAEENEDAEKCLQCVWEN